METPHNFEPAKSESVIRHLAASFIAAIRFVGRQLATAELNPHEGRLRGSIIPGEYIDIPDYPAAHDDL